MPKVKISEYSATANSNTDVASINIDEGCAPSGINNAIRAVMGHLKDFQQGTNGDPFNGPVNGTLGATTPSTVAATSISASTTLGVTGVSTLTGGAVIEGLTVGRGGAGGAANTAYGASAIPIAPNSGVVAIGSNAGKLFNTASDTGQSTFVGYFAGAQVSTGTDSTFVGGSAGTNTTTGAKNTAVGSQALQLNTTASYNTAVGYKALYANTIGELNTAVGLQAAQNNTTGSGLAAIGQNALVNNTTGAYNTALGKDALLSNTTASYSTAVGYQAGYSQTTGGASAGYNAYFGQSAGYASTGYQNTLIGRNAGSAITTGNANTILGQYNGNQGGLDIRTASNYIVLSDGDGNPRGYFDDSGQFNVKNSGVGIFCLKGYATSASFGGIVVDAFADRNTTNSSFAAYRYYNVGAGAVKFIVQDSGNVQNTNNSYGATSDIKLKENIVDASPKLEDLCKVKIRQYNLKSDPTHKQIGVIAQELEEVFAGMVEESADRDAEGNDLGTKTKAVKYSVFVPMLVKAIQELKAEVDSLKAQINGASA